MTNKSQLARTDLAWGLGIVVLIVLQVWWLPGEKRSAADSYSNSTDGQLGLYRTLSLLFENVNRLDNRLLPDGDCTLLLIAPDRTPNAVEEERLYEFVTRGGRLLFAVNENLPGVNLPLLGIHSSRPGSGLSSEALFEMTDDHDTDKSDTEPLVEFPSGPSISPKADLLPVPELRVNAPDEVTVSGRIVNEPVTWRSSCDLTPSFRFDQETLVLSERGSEVMMWRLGAGLIMVSSGAEIFSNRSLLFPASRRLAIRLVHELHDKPLPKVTPLSDAAIGGEYDSDSTESQLSTVSDPDAAGPDDGNGSSIVVSEFLNASASYRDTGVLLSPMLRAGTLQLIVLAVLCIWMGFHSFGPAHPARRRERRSLNDSARATGNLQYRLKDGGIVVRTYLDYLNSQLRRRLGGAVGLDDYELIALRTGLPSDEVRVQLETAEKLSLSSSVSSSEAAASVRWLASLRARLFRS